jgi:hypothetical protein
MRQWKAFVSEGMGAADRTPKLPLTAAPGDRVMRKMRGMCAAAGLIGILAAAIAPCAFAGAPPRPDTSPCSSSMQLFYDIATSGTGTQAPQTSGTATQ